MSSFLYRLGHAVARRAGRTLAAWLVLLLGTGALAAGLGGTLQDDLTIPGTESQRGLDVLDQRFPEVAGVSGQLLFVAPEGEQVRAYDDQVRRVLQRTRDVDHVLLATDPFEKGGRLTVSKDGRHALSQVQLDIPLDRLEESTVAELEEATELPSGAGLEVHLGGSLFANKQVEVTWVEGVGVLLALVVLAVTFGSLLAAGMPIVTAVVGVGVSMAALLVVAAFGTVNTSTPTLALMIGLAVGIDYALFLVSRHRGQLAGGMDVRESVARATATAGSAVIFAGATVVIALLGLVVARIPFLTVMGVAAAGAVAVAVTVAVTMVPAMLALAGERLRPRPGSRTARNAAVQPGETHTLGARWVAAVTRFPAVTAVLVVGLLLAAALPAKDLALGLPDNGTAEPGASERVTYDLVTEAFGPGFNAPLLVTVDIIRTTDPLGVMDALGADLGRLDGVEAIGVTTPNRKADLGIVQVVPERAQTDEATADLVRDIRARADALEREHGVEELTVTGHTAVTIDVSDRLRDALLPFGLVVVGLSLLLLTVLFRSVAVPVKATLGYLLSVGASFGAVVAVFQWGWFAELLNVTKVGPVISFLPILLMGVLFGLAMDYEVFLVSRMREEFVHTRDALRSVTVGFTSSARVVTAAAVIMISVFAAFIPHSDMSVKPIAVGLAVGVFVDAFLVRMTLVPAVLAMLGERAWWLPERLDRALPTLDVEGEALVHHLEHERWTEEHGPATVRAESLTVGDGDRTLVPAVDLLVRPGDLAAVVADDRVARRALLAAVAGRLPHDGGRLVVLDRVLPDEAGAVRRRVAFLTGWPTRAELLALERRLSGGEELLVVLDDLDDLPPEESAQRWTAAANLVARGATVVAGCSTSETAAAAAHGATAVPLDAPLPAPVPEVVP
ncbi:MAG TPA: MMPL family transporter [Nocardioides sp.]|nr:MMPL family transporter [Nocardioides sp.]